MEWYVVTKWIKGRPYLYEQRTWREEGRVRTESRYLGRDLGDQKTSPIDEELEALTGKAWRIYMSVLDAIEFEEKSAAGISYDHLSPEVRAELANIDSQRLVRVTRRKSQADRYGKGTAITVGKGARIISENEDGVFLVLLKR